MESKAEGMVSGSGAQEGRVGKLGGICLRPVAAATVKSSFPDLSFDSCARLSVIILFCKPGTSFSNARVMRLL